MSKAVLISIRPKWCELIASGKKTIEVRKTRPKIETPFKCYIYCTSNGRPLVYGDKPCADGWTEAYTLTYGYSCEEADKIWGVMNGKVIGEFVCDRVERFDVPFPAYMVQVDTQQLKAAHLSYIEAHTYLGHRSGYGWHISNLVIYDEPKKLSEFTGLRKTKFGVAPYKLKLPFQSWGYVYEIN